MSRTLYAHQQRALEELPHGGGYLAFEQGLGKTLTAIKYAEQHSYRRMLVVCPAVAVGVWEMELDETDTPVLSPEGTRKDKAEAIASAGSVRWLVLNYEALLDPAVEKAVHRWGPELVIVDEAQKIKNPTAKRSKILHRLGKTAPVLALSGTPVTKNLLDLYSQYKAIDPGVWGNLTWTAFKARYGVWGGYGGYELIGYQNTEELIDRIRPLTVVGRKADTLDLPEKTHVRIPVRLSERGWSDYKTMATTGVLGDWVTSNPLEKALRLSQVSGYDRLGATSDLVKSLTDAGEQVVVYYRFRQEGGALRDLLEVPDHNGDTPIEERRRLVEQFQAGTLPVFLSQITAGSTAITLTNASHMVYHSLSYAYEDWAQSQDRIHRIGQYDPCTYYYPLSTGPAGGKTIDHIILDSLEHKDDVAGIITRTPSLLLPEE